VLLKYRVPDSGPHDDAGHQKYPKAPMALEDAQRTMRLIRFHAPSITSIRTRLGYLDFQRAGIWWQTLVRIMTNACIRLWMRPTK
jgi:hypothetical protein